VDAIAKYTDNSLYETLVVDDGSAATEVEALIHASLDKFRFTTLDRNMFFGEANNIGVEMPPANMSCCSIMM
jgi:GT2 family glycosyltransferase